MSMFEGRRRRDVVKKQRLKYEKRIASLDPDHADKLLGMSFPANFITRFLVMYFLFI